VLDDVVQSCDFDGMLDVNETGLLTVTLFNPIGSIYLSHTTASVSSPTPGIVFPSGNTISFPPSQVLGTTTASLRVRLSSVAGAQVQSFTVQATDTAFPQPGTRNGTFQQWGNADEAPSASDNLEESTPAWGSTGPQLSPSSTPWIHQQESYSINHNFYVEDPADLSDRYLVSPGIEVGSGPFSFSFEQSYWFDYNGTIYHDGGVVEITQDGGAHWIDIGASLSPGYNGTLAASANPLQGRPAFVGSHYSTVQAVTANLGTTYANRTVQVRFRMGADDNGWGEPGWWLDNFSFTGLHNTPFINLVGDPGPCAPVAVDDVAPAQLSFATAGSNPVTGTPALRFALPHATRVRITVYDISGRQVATLVDGPYSAGEHVATWQAARVGPGVYFARMIADGRTLGGRMVLLGR